MSLRSEIETLAIWWIPAAILSVVLNFVITVYARSLFGDEEISTSLDSILGLMQWQWFFLFFIRHLENFVVAIWFSQRFRGQYRAALIWSFLGLATGLIGVLIHMALVIYEKDVADEAS